MSGRKPNWTSGKRKSQKKVKSHQSLYVSDNKENLTPNGKKIGRPSKQFDELSPSHQKRKLNDYLNATTSEIKDNGLKEAVINSLKSKTDLKLIQIGSNIVNTYQNLPQNSPVGKALLNVATQGTQGCANLFEVCIYKFSVSSCDRSQSYTLGA